MFENDQLFDHFHVSSLICGQALSIYESYMGTYYPDHEFGQSDMDIFFSSCCKLSATPTTNLHVQIVCENK